MQTTTKSAYRPYFSFATLTAAIVLATSVAGCQKISKPSNTHKPTPLVKMTNSKNVIAPLFAQNGTGKFTNRFGAKPSNKTTLSQQATAFKTAIDDKGYVNATADGTVQAYDNQGKRVWDTKFNQGLLAGVAVDSLGHVAVVSDSKGAIIAVDRLTGKTIWRTPLDTATLAPALISNNRVITLGNDGKITALSLESGKVIWNFGTQNPSLSVRGSAMPMLLDAKTVIVSTADGRIHALNTDDGVPIWARRFAVSLGSSDIERLADIDATPVLDGSMLYIITYSGQLVAADMASRQLAFVKDFASLKSVSVDDSQLYVTTLTGDIIAMDKMTGNIHWQSDALMYRGLSNPVSIGNYVIVGDALGYLHVFDKQSGTQVDRKQASSGVALLQSSNQRLIVQSANGAFSVWQVNR